jgi:ATP adenylyltransferase
MMTLLNDSIEILQKELDPQGFNTGMNLGKAAGAGIEDHIHMHIVPRWTADTNFMPVLGHTRVVPDALQTTCKQLSEHFVKRSTR